MRTADAITAYTSQVLSFALGKGEHRPSTLMPPAEPDAATAKWAARLVRAWSREARPCFLLLGLWQPRLAADLRGLLPAGVRLAVADLNPEIVRAAMGRPGAEILAGLPSRTGRADHGAALLCDTSAWAQRLLWGWLGLEPGNTFVVVNPLLPTASRGPYRELERLLELPVAQVPEPDGRLDKERLRRPEGMIPPGPPHFSGRAPVTTSGGRMRPSLSLAAILHPAEPGLPGFFAAVPDWVEQVCVVWDAVEPPDTVALGIAPDPRRVETARPLAGDFAAQRNHALAMCRSEWVLALDGDERLPDSLWAGLPALMARPEMCGYYFQRQTLYPDATTCKVGYGLWPDLQLRLFRNLPGVRYARPVHEIVEGLSGPKAVLAQGAIEHHSRLRKTPEELRRKLAIFDTATSGAFGHRLNAEYPCLARDLLPSSELDFPLRLIILPD